jgi:acylphosphatase
MKVSKRLRIFGRVQGVSYRESMRQEAKRLGVTGWVRNRKDGSVEAVVQGEAPLVEDLVRWCEHGPELARVERVETENLSNEPALSHFDRKPTHE